MTACVSEFRGRLKGSFTALVTPFSGGKLDEGKVRELAEFQISKGTSGLVPCGTTGESPTLTREERHRVVRICVDAARGRVPVLAGAGTNSTANTVELCRSAVDAGADALLVVAPYYNRPTQRGLFGHFRVVCESVDRPVVIYNIPSRTGVNVEPGTMALLNSLGGLAGVKESAGSTDQVTGILKECGPDFVVMCGDDTLTLPFLSVGAKGVISVVANIAPAETAAMVRAFLEGRVSEAFDVHNRLFDLTKALFIETNPGPVKTAMGILGMCGDELRLPLAAPEEVSVVKLRKAMQKFGFDV